MTVPKANLYEDAIVSSLPVEPPMMAYGIPALQQLLSERSVVAYQFSFPARCRRVRQSHQAIPRYY